MAERVRRVVRQTKARIFEGLTQLPGKLVSLFEPHTEITRSFLHPSAERFVVNNQTGGMAAVQRFA
jgi:hypothetical protein